METLNLIQGTPEWHTARATRFCASEAAAMMGTSPYMTRADLLRQKKTGIAPDQDDKQHLFNRGHVAEKLARPQAESFLQEDLFPCVGILDCEGLPLLSSFDGLTMAEDTVFECKLYSEAVAAMIASGDLTPAYWPQVEQQLLMSGASRCLFVGADDETGIKAQMWYESKPERRAALIAGWKQFQADLETYVPQEVIAAAVAAPQEQLPIVSIQVMGGEIAVRNNLDVFGDALRRYCDGIKQKPETDQDFADLEATVRTLKKAEEALKAAESSALAQTASIEQMQRTVKELCGIAQGYRLTAEKLVKVEKENRKMAICSAAAIALERHLAKLNERLGKPFMPKVPADFASAIKGKKLLSAMQDAVDQELTNAKLRANDIADGIELNLKAYAVDAAGYETLFPDLGQIVTKPADDFKATVKLRIAEHQEAERKRKEEAERRQQTTAAQPAPAAVQAPSGGQPQEVVSAVAQTGSWPKSEDLSPTRTDQQMREDINRAIWALRHDDLVAVDALIAQILKKPVYQVAA